MSGACAELSAETPVCAATGRCVECTDHADCASSVCDRDTRNCVDVADVVYVANGGFLGEDEIGADEPGCGVPQSKCLTIGYAIVNRLDRDAGRVWIRLADGLFEEALTFGANQTARLIGAQESRLARTGDRVTMVDVAEGVDLLLDRIILGTGGPSSRGVDCQGEARLNSTVRVRRSIVRGSAAGVIGSQCDIDIVESVVENNEVRGIRMSREPHSLVVLDSVVRNNGEGIEMDGGSLVVERTLIARNEGIGIALDETDFVVRNNFIVENGSNDRGDGGVLIERDGPNQRVFEFNTVAYNEATPFNPFSPGITCLTVAPIEIRNSIVWGNSGGNADRLNPDAQIQGFCEVSYSNVQGGLAPLEGSLTDAGNNIDTDPLFVDRFRENYRIEPESMAIDAADPDATVELDFDGNPRPSGPAPDIGAHEVQP